MDLSSYESITGRQVATANETLVTAQIARTKRVLETLLGYSLDSFSTNLYSERGKTQYENPCSIVDTDNLLAADAVVYAYRIFNYTTTDPFFFVDPFVDLHAVKLITTVDPISGSNGVTVKTFDDDELAVHYSSGEAWTKYIQHLPNYRRYECLDRTFQIAVDATWGFAASPSNTTIPDELKDVWADMTTWYSKGKEGVKSETIGPHSYSMFEDVAPEQRKRNLRVIQKYAGPHGEANPLRGNV